MQTSKLLSVIGLGVFCLTLVSVRADDTPSQAAARAALMEKMADLDGQGMSTTNAVAPAAAETNPSTSPAQSPEAAAPPVMVNAPETMTATNETPVTVAPVENTPATAPAVIATPPPAASNGGSEFSPVPPPSLPNSNLPTTPSGYSAATQAAMSASQTNATISSAPATPSAPAPSMSANPPATPGVNEATAKELGLNPLQPPPAPVSAAQQQQLQALLQRYEADQITPDEYQAERAKIMAGQ